MKKTLFAMLALATMLPAMAENWKLSTSCINPYEDILTLPAEYTNPDNYTLYLMAKENTDIASVQTELKEKTFTEFLSTSGVGNPFEFYGSEDNLLYIRFTPADTEFSTTIDANNIWGVCVYKNENSDDVKFQVVQGFALIGVWMKFNTDTIPGSGYTSFNVPEPATATLSLLALAGLATRRKRK